MTLGHPKMHPHTKFGIPTSNNISRYSSRNKVKVTVTQILVHDTPSSQDASTHQIWDSYLKNYTRYAPDTIILETKSSAQSPKYWYMTLRHPKMHPHTKFGIPNSNNIYKRYAQDMIIL